MSEPGEANHGPTSHGAETAAQLFGLLWSELVSMLGTAAAATLVRRATKRACCRAAELEGLHILHDGWEYSYQLPASWQELSPAEAPCFSELVRHELVPLLREFTGQIVLRRLGRVPALKDLGFAISEET